MQIGDLVDIHEKRGCGSYSRIDQKGLGIVINIIRHQNIDIGNIKNVNLGSSVYVLLSTGDVESFHKNDLIKM